MKFKRTSPPRHSRAVAGHIGRHACVAAASLTGLTLCMPLQAADAPSSASLSRLSLDTLLNLPVSGASRLPQRMSDTAASVTVIDADTIRALGARTLAEVLAGVRGIAVTSDRGYAYAGARGLMPAGDLNTRLLLLIDGNRVNDPVYDQAFLGDEFPLDLSEVERIEVIPGQGSAVYGANAMTAVVNVVTRSPQAGPRGTRVGLQGGSAGHRQLSMRWQGEAGIGALRLSASRTLADGEPMQQDGQWSDTVDNVRRTALHARWDGGGWQVTALHAQRDKALPLVPGTVFGSPDTRYLDTHSLLNVERRLSVGDTEWTGRTWLGRYDFRGRYRYDTPGQPTLSEDTGQARWGGVELRALLHPAQGHRLNLGTEWQRVPTLVQSSEDLAPVPAVYLQDRRQSTRGAVFAEEQWQFAPRWTLDAGARLDRDRSGDSRLNPRLGLVWQAGQRWVVKGIAGSAYRTPNAYEAHYTVPPPGGYATDPALHAETIRGRELAVEGWPEAHTRVAASLYENHMRDLIALTYDASTDLYRYRNVGDARARGIDGEVETRTFADTRLRLNVSVQFDRSDLAEGAMQQFPRRMAKLAWIAPCPRVCQVGLEGLATSRRDTAPGQAVWHLTLSNRTPTPAGWQWSVGVRNLTDHRAWDPPWQSARPTLVPQDGRQWRLALQRDL